jgi:ABC-type glutathione transport system ATPase component
VTALLEVQRACKTFRSGIGARRRRVMALADVSLSVGEGEIVALVGESGSGKSPLGRAVVGLERLDEARLFDSVEYACMSERSIRKLRPQMHLVLQDPYQSLHPGMRIATAVAEPLEIAGRGNAKSPRVAEALEEVGMTPASQFLDRYPHSSCRAASASASSWPAPWSGGRGWWWPTSPRRWSTPRWGPASWPSSGNCATATASPSWSSPTIWTWPQR